MTLTKIKSESDKLEVYNRIMSSPNSIAFFEARSKLYNTDFAIPSLFKISNVRKNSHL